MQLHLEYRQTCSHRLAHRHPGSMSLRTPFIALNFVLTRFQYDSIFCVWTPVTVRCIVSEKQHLIGALNALKPQQISFKKRVEYIFTAKRFSRHCA
jgi:hypothetical protein